MEKLTHCPVCNFTKFKQYSEFGRNVYRITCERCGVFEISEECIIFADIKSKFKNIGYILSGLSRELYETGGENPIFLTINLEKCAANYLVPDLNSVESKVNKLLERFRAKTTYFGEEILIEDLEASIALAYARNVLELRALLSLMREKKLVRTDESYQGFKICLLEKAWEIAGSKSHTSKDSKQGFVAIWFDDKMEESINAISSGITESGFIPLCIRDKFFGDKIMDKALGEIRQSRFVVVDLTELRPSVFFEAGFAHALGIETIYVYREDDLTKLEFYVKHYQCYGYSTADELKEIVKNAIKARV